MKLSPKTILLVATTLLVVSIALPTYSAGLLDQSQFQDPCDVCEFARLLSIIKNLVFEIAAPVAVLFIITGGVLLSASAGIPNQVERAKKMIISAIIGLVILICAWLIVSAVMAATLGGNIGSSWWNVTCPNDTQCKYQVPSTIDPTTPTDPGPTPGGGQMGADRTNAAPRMKDFMDCMSQHVPANESWKINSIMDYTHTQCNATNHGVGVGTCSHSPYSCHYGGRTCTDGSYAIDIDDVGAGDGTGLQSAVTACGGGWVYFEKDHYHVSTGTRFNCGCDK